MIIYFLIVFYDHSLNLQRAINITTNVDNRRDVIKCRICFDIFYFNKK